MKPESKTSNGKNRKNAPVEQDRLCFVIMPFSKSKSCSDWNNIYDNFIVPAINGSGFKYNCERSDIRGGAFIRNILFKLNSAHIVLADLTDMNPNVFYELGVRHVLKNRTILIAQNLDFVPSDLRAYGTVIYEPTIAGLKKFKLDIKKILKDIESNPQRPDSPVDDYLKNRSYLLFDTERETVIRHMMSLHSELFDSYAVYKTNMDEISNFNYVLTPHPILALEYAITSQFVNFSDEVYLTMKLFYFMAQKLNYLTLEDLVATNPRKKVLRSKYQITSKDFFKNVETLRIEIQEHVNRLQNESFELEPSQAIWRSLIFERVFSNESDASTDSSKVEGEPEIITE